MDKEACRFLAQRGWAWVIMMLVLGGSAFANSKSGIQSKYDKFKDFTEVSTKTLFAHWGLGVGGLKLSFRYICQGDTDSCHPDAVIADFQGAGTNGVYTEYHSVTFLADQIRFVPVEKESWNSNVSADSVRTSVYENISARFSVADFLKIANANDVEVEVGPTHFNIKGKQLELCRELAQKIGR